MKAEEQKREQARKQRALDKQAKQKAPKRKALGVGPKYQIPKECPHCPDRFFRDNTRLYEHIAAKHPEQLTPEEVRKYRDKRLSWVKCKDCRQWYVLKH